VRKIYRYYKDRLVEISGRSRSLYSRKTSKKTAFDIGRLLDGDYEAIDSFVDFLFSKRKTTFNLIDKNSKERICKNLRVQETVQPQFQNRRKMKKEESTEEVARRARLERNEGAKVIQNQVNDLKALKREIEELSVETGRCELFIGYPFVEGSIGRETIVRAPLLLFPASIHIENETTAVLELKPNEPVQLNKVFALAYSQRYKLDIDELVTEFDSLPAAKLYDIDAVVNYLRKFGFKLSHPQRKGMFDFSRAKEPYLGDPIEVKHYAIIGRYPLANAIYNDYRQLERRKATTAIRELLESRETKVIKKASTDLYTISALDFSQEEAIEKLNKTGNMVIYGPPGTGKSQTIVNIITDALCKNKKVLVVSQKKAALDVVFNRLGTLNDRAMYLTDPEKNKNEFYNRTKNTHLSIVNSEQKPNTKLEADFKKIRDSVHSEIAMLQGISDILFTQTDFGLSLQQMYVKSNGFGQSKFDRHIYQKLIETPRLMSVKYDALSDAVRVILEKRKDDLFYKKIEVSSQNPLASHIRSDLDVNTLNMAKSMVEKILAKRRLVPFDISLYPNARYLLTYYLESGLAADDDLRPIISAVAKLENKTQREVAQNFEKAKEGIKKYLGEYAKLEGIMDSQGFAMVIEGIINGNMTFVRLLWQSLNNYVSVRELSLYMQELGILERNILNFCYQYTRDFKEFKEAVKKIPNARVYHEVITAEEKHKNKLAKIMDYENIKNRIQSLKGEKQEVVRKICLEIFKNNYTQLYQSTPVNKNFFYQINKDKNLWAIRKLMEVYGDLMLAMFPCWLLSPESVSTIMPLKEGLFDLVLFDEASQVFIESTIPTIYRSNHIVVAGDNKQLRPTALFMRRYMGTDIDELSLDAQAALEVESLLDLTTSRYNSVNLNYHYRSRNEELITFSNYAFYDCKLQIAPNLTKNTKQKPIERIKVPGQWIDRKNKVEASEVVQLLKKIFKTRKNNETIGIITFNAEQENYIEDLIDRECRVDAKFSELIGRERSRKENGENAGLFVKNLENVQGDERDIIIFSIGYARNEYGKVISHFGPLNTEGGENRLNVAITRAKEKIYIITSIEPEELNVADTKNAGPKIFRKYLEYVRAVSNGQACEVATILEGLRPQSEIVHHENSTMATEIKSALEKMGYLVEANLGNNSYKLSLAIYDKQLDKYLVGIEFDDTAFNSSKSVVERDVFRAAFMESRGWTILRVWSRDYWLNPQKVLNRIDKIAKRSRRKTT